MAALGYHRVAIGVPLRILALIMLSAAFLFDAAAAGAASSRDPDAAVAAAINRLRGVHLEGMSAADKEALGARLDRAWDVLYDHPEEAEKAIVEVLATEKDDNFLLVDLAHLLTVLDPDHPEPAPAALLKAKVTADPPGTFHAAANMAAAHCAACLAAGDACEDARSRAWAVLGLLDDPQLVGAVTKRLAGAPPAPKIERLGIVHGLGAAFSPAATAPL